MRERVERWPGCGRNALQEIVVGPSCLFLISKSGGRIAKGGLGPGKSREVPGHPHQAAQREIYGRRGWLGSKAFAVQLLLYSGTVFEWVQFGVWVDWVNKV